MSDESADQYLRDHAQYMEERKGLIDAARESLRTFDQAVLAFGSAVFAASVAFLKDVAPNPLPFTLKWLGISWALFSVGLLAALLSFLFSHRACMFEIDEGAKALDRSYNRSSNLWTTGTDVCNCLSVGLLFCGLLSWSLFGFENVAKGKSAVNNSPARSNVQTQSTSVKK